MSCTFFKPQHNALHENINCYVITDLIIALNLIFPSLDNVTCFLNYCYVILLSYKC